MKHTKKVTLILIGMFFIAQLIGIFVAGVYTPEKVQIINKTTGETQLINQYNLPYGFNPPEDITPISATTSILIALAIAVSLMLIDRKSVV